MSERGGCAPRDVATLAPEDQARADFYALLARLFAERRTRRCSPPLPLRRRSLRRRPAMPSADRARVAPGMALRAAERGRSRRGGGEEYTDAVRRCGQERGEPLRVALDVGAAVGTPAGGVRAALATLGLARRAGVDASSRTTSRCCSKRCACWSREMAIGVPRRSASSASFSSVTSLPWDYDCCTAICECPVANYYRRVAEFTQLFPGGRT